MHVFFDESNLPLCCIHISTPNPGHGISLPLISRHYPTVASYQPFLCSSMTFDIISTDTSTAAFVAVLSGLIWHSRHRLAFLALTGCAKVRATCARAFQPTLTIDDDCHRHCAAQDSSKPAAPPLFPCVSCLLYTSPSPRDQRGSRMPSSA